MIGSEKKRRKPNRKLALTVPILGLVFFAAGCKREPEGTPEVSEDQPSPAIASTTEEKRPTRPAARARRQAS
jgi:hypothetical protein